MFVLHVFNPNNSHTKPIENLVIPGCFKRNRLVLLIIL